MFQTHCQLTPAQATPDMSVRALKRQLRFSHPTLDDFSKRLTTLELIRGLGIGSVRTGPSLGVSRGRLFSRGPHGGSIPPAAGARLDGASFQGQAQTLNQVDGKVNCRGGSGAERSRCPSRKRILWAWCGCLGFLQLAWVSLHTRVFHSSSMEHPIWPLIFSCVALLALKV